MRADFVYNNGRFEFFIDLTSWLAGASWGFGYFFLRFGPFAAGVYFPK